MHHLEAYPPGMNSNALRIGFAVLWIAGVIGGFLFGKKSGYREGTTAAAVEANGPGSAGSGSVLNGITASSGGSNTEDGKGNGDADHADHGDGHEKPQLISPKAAR